MYRKFLYIIILSSISISFSYIYGGEIDSKKLKGFVESVTFLDKSFGVCVTNDAVYLSKDDSLRWKAFDLIPKERKIISILHFVGGTPNRLYFVEQRAGEKIDEDFLLLVYEKGKTLKSIRKIPNRLCGFVSDIIGCYASNGSLVVTFDGGETWKESKSLFTEEELITQLLWLSPEEIMVGTDQGTVTVLAVSKNGTFEPRWKVSQSSLISALAVGNDSIVWTSGQGIIAYHKKSGKKLGAFKPDIQEEGISASGKNVYIWSYEGVSIWSLEKDGVEHIQKLDCPPVASVVPWDQGVALIITMDGKFLEWESKSGQLRDRTINIDNTAIMLAKKPEYDDMVATKEELREMVQLSLKVPSDIRQKIFKEANKKTELSHRERVKWAAKEFRRLITEQD